MTPGVISQLCAILRGESKDLPAGEGGERLLEMARFHRVDRLVRWRTGQVDDEARAEALLDEVHVRELNRVLASLDQRGVIPLVLKGAALAHTHYEESWHRSRIDSDVLVPADERQTTFDVLADLGYWRPPAISGDLVTYQAQFVRSSAGGQEHVLDVHWRVANPQLVADVITYDELASRACTISVRGQSMRTPCPVDALLVACVHRAAHHDDADDLLWIYDLHLIAARFTRTDWGDVVRYASDRGVRALCVRGLEMSVERFHTVVPPDVLERLSAVGRPLERSSVYVKQDMRRVDRLMIDLRALGPHASVRLLWEHVMPPSDYIGAKYHVRHRALLPAFYVRRVVEGLSKWFARAG